MKNAHAKLAAKANPNLSEQGKASSKDSSTVEPMDFETTHASRHRRGSRTRMHCASSQSSTHALAERCKELEEKLQLSNQRLQETCDAGGLIQVQARLASMSGEHDGGLKRVQELLTEGRTLEARHQELKVQLATATAEFESRLQVADIELEIKQRQYEREAEFAQGQKAEVERLTNDLKEVRGEIKTQKAELDAL